MLYARDFTKLTAQENRLWQEAEAALAAASKSESGIPSEALIKYWDSMPLAAEHAKQLFPNNYLRIHGSDDLEIKQELNEKKNKFKALLNNGAGERELVNFIKKEEAAFIVASILKNHGYGLGHHVAFAFREFELPPNYRVDFLLIGKGSGGYEFIFVELESPVGRITTAEEDFGEVIRKGIRQVEDWESWLEANYSNLTLIYNKALGNKKQLPREFFEFDKSRMHFAVVAGRREDFSAKIHQRKRRWKQKSGGLLLHYDNLLDSAELFIQHGSY